MDPPSQDASDSRQASRVSRWLASAALRLPRLAPTRIVSWRWRQRMLRQGAEPFTVTLADGAVMDALYYPAKVENQSPRLPVILSHGYLESKEFHHREAELLRRAGHDVMLYDLRAHGRSGGALTTLGALEHDDLTYLIDVCQQRRYIGDRVVTMGYSTGAATVIQHAATDLRIAAVVALTPFVDMIGAIRSFHQAAGGWCNERQLLRGFKHIAQEQGFDLMRSNTLEAIRRVRAPLLLAVGDQDAHLPMALHAVPLREAAGDGLVEFHLIPGRNHLSIYWRMTDQLCDAIVRFCAKAQ